MTVSIKVYVFVIMAELLFNVIAPQDTLGKKCKSPPQDVLFGIECFKEASGKGFDLAEAQASMNTQEARESIIKCVDKKKEILSEDGETFQAYKAKEYIDTVEATDEIKEAIKSGIDECVEKYQDDANHNYMCYINTYAKHCRG